MDTSNELDNIARKAHKRHDASVKQVLRDLKFIEGLYEHDGDRATYVHQDTSDIEVGDVCSNDQLVVMRKDDATLLFAKGNRVPAYFGHFQHAPTLDTEDLMLVGKLGIILDGVVGCAYHSRVVADGGDHVDLALVGV